jgi:hypothetical protein
MASGYDPSEFIDSDFQSQRPVPAGAGLAAAGSSRGPTREEVDSRVVETQQKLAELKRAQEELERERVALEETRRRQSEFQTGRQEMQQNLTRGVGLLEEAEFSARQEAEQLSKTLGAFREALSKISAVREDSWTKDNFNVELTRALTILDNSRMEWNSARLKFPILSATPQQVELAKAAPAVTSALPLGPQGFAELCRVGFALTWPLALVGLLGIGVLVAVLLHR